MFEILKARIIVRAANKGGLLLLPDDETDREIAESMFLECAPVPYINANTLEMYRERRKVKMPMFVSNWQPAAETKNGPLQPLNMIRYR